MTINTNNSKSVNLPYNYAVLNENNCCVSSRTCSYEIPLDNYISVPNADDDYIGHYYSYETDLWYEDSLCTIEADDINDMYHA